MAECLDEWPGLGVGVGIGVGELPSPPKLRILLSSSETFLLPSSETFLLPSGETFLVSSSETFLLPSRGVTALEQGRLLTIPSLGKIAWSLGRYTGYQTSYMAHVRTGKT